MVEETRARTRCPKCDGVAVRLEVKVAGTGGGLRQQAVQPRGGELAPGPLFLCRTHGAFTVTADGASPETVEERRARLAGALKEVLSEYRGP